MLTILKEFLLPPALPLLMMALSFLLWRRVFLSRTLLLLAWLSLWVLSLPIVSAQLLARLEQPYLSLAKENAQALQAKQDNGVGAVVILGGGREYRAPEYMGVDQLSHQALWRLRYGVDLAQSQSLPILLSGGTVYAYEQIAEAALAEDTLKRSFRFEGEIWREENSRNTWENAHNSARLLAEKGISQVYLVTHAYHMRRAEQVFRLAGLDVVPMPTGFVSTLHTEGWDVWVPKAKYLLATRTALHEELGYWVYRVRAQISGAL